MGSSGSGVDEIDAVEKATTAHDTGVPVARLVAPSFRSLPTAYRAVVVAAEAIAMMLNSAEEEAMAQVATEMGGHLCRAGK